MRGLLGPREPWLAVDEHMDRPDASGPDLDRALEDLEVIHDRLGGHRCAILGLEAAWCGAEPCGQVEILDVGCGGGQLVRTASAWAAGRGGRARVTLMDFNCQICSRAHRRFVQPAVLQADMFRTPFAVSTFDAVHCGLVLHHFDEARGAELLRRLATLCRRALIVSDLHRHPVPYLATAWGSRLLGCSRMVRHDGPLSIRRGFSRLDLVAVARRAGFEWTLLRRVWPYRWLAVLRTGSG